MKSRLSIRCMALFLVAGFLYCVISCYLIPFAMAAEDKPPEPPVVEEDGFSQEDMPILELGDDEEEEKVFYPEFEEAGEALDEVDSLDAAINRANNAISNIALSMDEQEEKIKENQASIEEFEYSLGLVQAQRERVYDSSKEFIRFLYESRMDFNLVSSFLRSKSLAEFLNLQSYVSEILLSFSDSMDEVCELESDIKKRTSELELLKRELSKQKDELASTQKEFAKELDSLKKQLEKAEERAKDAQAAAEALAARLAAMEEDEREALELTDPSTLGESYSWDESVISEGKDFWQSDSFYDYSNEELVLLAGIIQAEAGNQPYEGKIAVGSVVMNRVESDKFPNTISGVIYSPNQFTPAGSGRLAVILSQGPTAECMQAALDVLNGKRNVSNLYFKSADYAASHGITGIQIADQVFH